jgi:hypothetical protein
MADVFAAAVRSLSAATLFAYEQCALAVTGAERRRDATARFYRLAQSTQDAMNDGFWAVYQIGDYMQRAVLDVFSDLTAAGPNGTDVLCEAARDALAQLVRSLSTAANKEDRNLAAVQLLNTINVFRLVKNIGDLVSLSGSGPVILDPLLDCAYGLGDYAALWAVEGLGAVYADRRWEQPGAAPRDLLRDVVASPRSSSLTMLHAGMGLAFARRLLKPLTPFDPPFRIEQIVTEYVSLCETNGQPAYLGACYESLGLVTRTWHAALVPYIDRELRTIDPVAREYFWHGAGRALYFFPPFVIPGALSAWRAILREAPDETARLNMKAGLSWAFTIVNVRQPEILSRFAETNTSLVEEDDAFADGMVSALVMALDTVPNNPLLDTFCGRIGGVRALAHACSYVDEAFVEALRKTDRLGELFRYHIFPGWFDLAIEDRHFRRHLAASASQELVLQ